MQVDTVTNSKIINAAYTKLYYDTPVASSLAVHIFLGKADYKQLNVTLAMKGKVVVSQRRRGKPG